MLCCVRQLKKKTAMASHLLSLQQKFEIFVEGESRGVGAGSGASRAGHL